MYPNLKLQLWKSGLRQNQFARMISIDETLLSRVVNGFREPSPELRIKISSVLQTDPDWLFERSTTPPPSSRLVAGRTKRAEETE